MKKYILLGVIYSLSYSLCLGYNSLGEFLESKNSGLCVLASDGCNTFILKNKQLYGGSSLSCQNHKIKWKCESYKQEKKLFEDFINIDEIDIKREQIKKENTSKDEQIKKDYSRGKFINRVGDKIGSKKISYEDSLKKNIGRKYLGIANRFLKKYKKILSKQPLKIQNEVHKKVLKRLDEKIKIIKSEKVLTLLQYLHLKIKELL